MPGPLPGTGFISGRGDNGFDSESLIAYELGYRIQPNGNFSLDVAAFYNDYDKLSTSKAGTPFPRYLFPYSFSVRSNYRG